MKDDNWEVLCELKQKMDSAELRCKTLALSESLMGYPESANAYKEIATESKLAYAWIYQMLTNDLYATRAVVG